MIFAATSGFFDNIEMKHVLAFENQMLAHFEMKHKDLLAEINNGKKMSDDLQRRLKASIEEFAKRFDPNASQS